MPRQPGLFGAQRVAQARKRWAPNGLVVSISGRGMPPNIAVSARIPGGLTRRYPSNRYKDISQNCEAKNKGGD